MNLEAFLPHVRRPGRYLGTEVHARRKPWNGAAVRTALVFPDLYEIGMSHLGLQILYHILNDLPWALADRVFCPDLDMEALLRKRGVPLAGLETRRPLLDFDILGVTLPYELCYGNILTVLDLAGIPVWHRERKDSQWPLILGGGSCSLNPEPVADIFDAILVGDGEEAIEEIARLVRSWKESREKKEELLDVLARIEGVYVPSLYCADHDPTGRFLGLHPEKSGPGKVRRRVISDLDNAPFPVRPVIPFLQIVHDRLGVEVARGCTRGCRFCQAGITYRPVRERSPQRVLTLADQGLRASGWEEISLLSLSTGDYGCLAPVLASLMDRSRSEHVAVSLPSLRVGTLTPEITAEIRKVRKTGFTLAPEAGTERLRKVINKGISEHDLLETAGRVFAAGWKNIKLYFMVGLPTETREDVLEIAELARRVLAAGGRGQGRQVTVSVGTFVPKPHTPFQWEGQLSAEEARDRIELLRSQLRSRAIQLKWHDPRQSVLEGAFSRGDRRIAEVLHRAWSRGSRLDAWSDHARPDLYDDAAAAAGIDLQQYIEPRDIDEPLPWDHVDTGVQRDFLIQERERARREVLTPDCRQGECQGCGVCDFVALRPITCTLGDTVLPPREAAPIPSTCDGSPRFNYRMVFSKTGDARFLGHLEVVHVFHRAARRAGLPLVYTQGHHPMPRFSFGPALPVGTESLGEPMSVVLTDPIDPARVCAGINRELPPGIEILRGELMTAGTSLPLPITQSYLVRVPEVAPGTAEKALNAFHSASKWRLTRNFQRKTATFDLMEHVQTLRLASAEEERAAASAVRPPWPGDHTQEGGKTPGCNLILALSVASGPKPKPSEIVKSVLDLTDFRTASLRILKLDGKKLIPGDGTPAESPESVSPVEGAA